MNVVIAGCGSCSRRAGSKSKTAAFLIGNGKLVGHIFQYTVENHKVFREGVWSAFHFIHLDHSVLVRRLAAQDRKAKVSGAKRTPFSNTLPARHS